MDHARWHEPSRRTLQMYLHAVVPEGGGRHVDESLLIVVQGAGWPVAVRLPPLPWGAAYRLLWDSAYELPPGVAGGPDGVIEPGGAVLTVDAGTIRVYGATA
jgi:isoamylase